MMIVKRFLDWAVVAVVCAWGAALSAAPATRPFAGVVYAHEVRADPPLHLHIVTVDLRDPRVHVRVARAGDDPDGEGPWTTTLLAPSVIAQRDGLDVAVNGDFFIPKDSIPILGRKVPYFATNWARPCGLAVSRGEG